MRKCSTCVLIMGSGTHVPRVFIQNYSPFHGRQGKSTRDGARQLGFFHPQPQSQHPLPGMALRRCAPRDGDLLHRPLRCRQTKRTKPVALGSAQQVGAAGAGLGLGWLAGVHPSAPPSPFGGVGLPPAEHTAAMPAAQAWLRPGGAATRSHVGHLLVSPS